MTNFVPYLKRAGLRRSISKHFKRTARTVCGTCGASLVPRLEDGHKYCPMCAPKRTDETVHLPPPQVWEDLRFGCRMALPIEYPEVDGIEE